jgi:hypothetical protein
VKSTSAGVRSQVSTPGLPALTVSSTRSTDTRESSPKSSWEKVTSAPTGTLLQLQVAASQTKGGRSPRLKGPRVGLRVDLSTSVSLPASSVGCAVGAGEDGGRGVGRATRGARLGAAVGVSVLLSSTVVPPSKSVKLNTSTSGIPTGVTSGCRLSRVLVTNTGSHCSRSVTVEVRNLATRSDVISSTTAVKGPPNLHTSSSDTYCTGAVYEWCPCVCVCAFVCVCVCVCVCV